MNRTTNTLDNMRGFIGSSFQSGLNLSQINSLTPMAQSGFGQISELLGGSVSGFPPCSQYDCVVTAGGRSL